MAKIRNTAAALLFAFAAIGDVGMAQAACVSDRDFRQLAARGQVVSLPDALRSAGVRGQVIEAQLCEAGGGYSYRVRVRQRSGEIRSLNIPAG